MFLADALHYMHQHALTHRDIKPSNIIFVGGVCKLADIGLVAGFGERTFVGTEGFVPPEGPGTPQADIYSLGKVLYEMSSGKDRMEFPEVPTLSELGIKGAELDIWFGMWAPNGTPPDVSARMATEIGKALKLATIKTRYEALGAEPVGLDNAEFRSLLVSEAKQLSAVIRDSKISVD